MAPPAIPADHSPTVTTGYRGAIDFDASKPDGTPRKLMDNSRLNALGWQARGGLEEGLGKATEDFLVSHEAASSRIAE